MSGNLGLGFAEAAKAIETIDPAKAQIEELKFAEQQRQSLINQTLLPIELQAQRAKLLQGINVAPDFQPGAGAQALEEILTQEQVDAAKIRIHGSVEAANAFLEKADLEEQQFGVEKINQVARQLKLGFQLPQPQAPQQQPQPATPDQSVEDQVQDAKTSTVIKDIALKKLEEPEKPTEVIETEVLELSVLTPKEKGKVIDSLELLRSLGPIDAQEALGTGGLLSDAALKLTLQNQKLKTAELQKAAVLTAQERENAAKRKQQTTESVRDQNTRLILGGMQLKGKKITKGTGKGSQLSIKDAIKIAGEIRDITGDFNFWFNQPTKRKDVLGKFTSVVVKGDQPTINGAWVDLKSQMESATGSGGKFRVLMRKLGFPPNTPPKSGSLGGVAPTKSGVTRPTPKEQTKTKDDPEKIMRVISVAGDILTKPASLRPKQFAGRPMNQVNKTFFNQLLRRMKASGATAEQLKRANGLKGLFK